MSGTEGLCGFVQSYVRNNQSERNGSGDQNMNKCLIRSGQSSVFSFRTRLRLIDEAVNRNRPVLRSSSEVFVAGDIDKQDEIQAMIEEVRDLEKIPNTQSAKDIKTWLKRILVLQSNECYDSITCAQSLRLLVSFMDSSTLHQRAIHSFLKQSSFITRWSTKAKQVIPTMSPINCATTLYHLAVLDIGTPLLGTDLLLMIFIRATKDLSEVPANSLGNMMWATGYLSLQPPQSFLDQWVDVFVATSKSASKKCFLDSIWALSRAQIDIHENAQWSKLLSVWCNDMLQFAAQISTQEHADLIWAIGNLKCPNLASDHELVAQWVSSFKFAENTLSAVQITNCLSTFAKFSVEVEDSMIDSMLSELETKCSELDITGVVDLISSLSTMDKQMPEKLFEEWNPVAAEQMKDLDSSLVSPLLDGFRGQSRRPSDALIDAFEDCIGGNIADSLSCEELCLCVQFISRLKKGESISCEAKILESLRNQLQSASANDLALMIETLGSSSLEVSKEFLAQWLQCVRVRGTDFTFESIVQMMTGFASMRGLRVPEGLVLMWLDSVKAVTESDSLARTLSIYMWNLGRLDLSPTAYETERYKESWSSMSSVISYLIEKHAGSMTTAEISNGIWGLARSFCAIGAESSSALLSSFESQMHDASPQSLANLLWAVSNLKSDLTESFKTAWASNWVQKSQHASPNVSRIASKAMIECNISIPE
eukprot:CAMPEP_0182446568 /NCGR_PEP_ID=MMETSP1172-20130603/4285_1 /TAXON_ID=708627 /ORGANISM="Timspurckia oligopyrenoides, Strain CCMP3278" /LENGTH=709 /DNA_ID=CAMNT_0024642519 /DNA_START=1 /DNA_END=2127 /DNA_ORIENTATION=-